MKENLLLLDADVICYQFAFKNQVDIDWDYDGDITSVLFHDRVYDQVDSYITSMVATVGATDVLIILSDNIHNFRKDILPSYKENRKKVEKPKLWRFIRDYLESDEHGYRVDMRPSLEGDDLLGIYATHPKYNTADKKTTVATIDKDLNTVPCNLFLFNKQDLGVKPIEPLEAVRFHLKQVLTGDTVDGYKGLPGVGKVRANKLLDDVEDIEEMWSIIVETYESKGLTEADALVQARVAYILQYQDYNTKTQEVKPWTIQTSIRNFKRS